MRGTHALVATTTSILPSMNFLCVLLLSSVVILPYQKRAEGQRKRGSDKRVGEGRTSPWKTPTPTFSFSSSCDRDLQADLVEE